MKKFIFLLIFIFSCSSTSKNIQTTSTLKKEDEKPKWITEESYDGKSAIGIARLHIKGKNAQRKLAISRAIEEIAMQMGTKVSTVQKIKTKKENNKATAYFSSYSVQTSMGKTVYITVRKIWEDNKTGEIYVLVTKD